MGRIVIAWVWLISRRLISRRLIAGIRLISRARRCRACLISRACLIPWARLRRPVAGIWRIWPRLGIRCRRGVIISLGLRPILGRYGRRLPGAGLRRVRRLPVLWRRRRLFGNSLPIHRRLLRGRLHRRFRLPIEGLLGILIVFRVGIILMVPLLVHNVPPFFIPMGFPLFYLSLVYNRTVIFAIKLESIKWGSWGTASLKAFLFLKLESFRHKDSPS